MWNKPLVLLRHAQSQWNLENRLTGWADVSLTEAGRAEARAAAGSLRAHGMYFDRAFVSLLRRATETLEIVLRELGQETIPIDRNWRLNERHYGIHEGENKAAFAAAHGADGLKRLRRSLRHRPESQAANDPRHPRNQSLYRDIDPALLSGSESLADMLARLLPYWNETIVPALVAGERVLLVSHGNTLHALLMHLENMSESEAEDFEIPTGRPLVITSGQGVPGLIRRYYLDSLGPSDKPNSK